MLNSRPMVCCLVAVLLAVTAASTGHAADDPIPSFLPEGRSKAFLGVVSMPNQQGATVQAVVPQSSAFQIGIQVGDIIEEIDGFKIGVINGATYSLPSEIRRSGDEVSLVIRDQSTGTAYKRAAKVGGRATNKGSPNSIARLGVTSQVDGRGETIVQVFPGTVGASVGLRPGDLITHVDGYRVAVIDGNVYSLASEIRHSPSGCTLTVQRGGQEQNVLISFGARPVVTNRVHVLLIGLTDDDKIGKGITVNLDQVRSLLEQVPPEKLGTIKRIDGDQCRAATILSALKDLNVAADESVFVYYAGHGAYDPNANTNQDPSGGHFFQIPGGDLRRSTVWELLAAKRARLTVLVTDTCNVPSLPVEVAAAPGAGMPPEPPIVTLLLRHQGYVDISGSSRNQFGWYNSTGGVFTNAFTMSVVTGSGNWGDLIRASAKQTRTLYADLKKAALAAPDLPKNIRDSLVGQADQSPQAFRLDVRQD